MEQRLIALEERFLFLERHVGELDGVVRGLAEDLDALKRELRRASATAEQRHDQVLQRLESREPGSDLPDN